MIKWNERFKYSLECDRIYQNDTINRNMGLKNPKLSETKTTNTLHKHKLFIQKSFLSEL